MKSHRFFGFLLMVFLYAGMVTVRPNMLSAQVQTTTSVSGIVTDSTGAVVAGASVTVKNQGTGSTQTLATNSTGFYSFPSLSPGTYTVIVSHEGFDTTEVKDRVLDVAQPASVDVSLRVGRTSQTVTVTGAGAELLSTSTAEISANVSSMLVSAIPLVTRDFMDLAALTPGVVPQNISSGVSIASSSLNFVQSSYAAPAEASGVFISGNRDVSANVSIDGSTTESPIYNMTVQLQSPEDIQEMRVEAATMNPEFGNGLSAINIVTKSGSNAFHGDLYEFLRNNHLDAAPFFTNLAGQKLPNYQQNQFGFTFGGPIKKNKLFFFGNFEGYRLRESDFSEEPVPDAYMRQGDFSHYQPSLGNNQFGPTPTVYNPFQYDPVTGLRKPFPGNQIPLGPTTLCAPQPQCVDPAALAFLQKWVLPPNQVIDGIPYATADTRTWINRNQGTVRLDWNKSAKSNIYGRWTDFKTDALSGGVQPLEGTSSPYSEQNLVIHWTKTISSSVVNDFMASYARPRWFFQRKHDVPNVSDQIGLRNTSADVGGPDMGLSEYILDGSTTYDWQTTSNKFQVKDDFRKVKGRHNMAFGGEVINDRFIYHNLSGDKGYFGFAPQFSAACPAGNDACTAAFGTGDQGGFDLADYFMGAWNESLLLNSAAPYGGHQTYYGFYGQDSWRVSSKLTVNFGLRYEFWSPWLVPRNTTASFNFTTGTILYALQNPFDYLDPAKCLGSCAPLNPGVPRSSYKNGNKNFEPRIGMAYQVTPNTTFRASFGQFDDDNINMVLFVLCQDAVSPFFLRDETYQVNSQQVPTGFMTGSYPAPAPTALPKPYADPVLAFRYVSPYYPTPTLYQWSASVQRRLGSSWSLETNYVGSHTIHQLQYVDMNSPELPQGAFAGETLQARRRYPGWSTIGTWLPEGYSKYESLLVSLKNNPWHGLSMMSNFMWAKNLTTMDASTSEQDSVDFRYPYIWTGPADFTPVKSLTLGYNYTLPFGKGRALASSAGPVLDKVVSGWTLSGITRFSTGASRRVVGPDNSGGSNTSGSADLNKLAGCNPNSVPGGKNRFAAFNAACFALPPYGVLGNSTIGSITSPGINNWDLSLSKVTRTGFPKESGEVQFRAEMFNAFNHTQWGAPDTYGPTSVEPTLGWVFSTRPPRLVQFTLKYIF